MMHTDPADSPNATRPTLRDEAVRLRVRHVMQNWFTVTDGIGAWSVKAFWHKGEVVTSGGCDAARLAVEMYERGRVVAAQFN